MNSGQLNTNYSSYKAYGKGYISFNKIKTNVDGIYRRCRKYDRIEHISILFDSDMERRGYVEENTFVHILH